MYFCTAKQHVLLQLCIRVLSNKKPPWKMLCEYLQQRVWTSSSTCVLIHHCYVIFVQACSVLLLSSEGQSAYICTHT